jgi:hypothetical protein
MERLGGQVADTNQPVPSYPRVARDAEIQLVLTRITRGLRRVDSLRGPARDEALTVLEQYAGLYALALFLEIERLDAELMSVCTQP